MTVLYSEDKGEPGATVPFSLDPIFLKLEGGRYVGMLLPMTLAEVVSGRLSGSGSGGNGRGGVGM